MRRCGNFQIGGREWSLFTAPAVIQKKPLERSFQGEISPVATGPPRGEERRLHMTWNSLTPEDASRWAGWLWTLLAAVWLLMWFTSKQAKKLETPLERLQHVIPMGIGLWLMFGKAKDWGWLNRRLLPQVPAVWMTGLVITALGIGIAIYARLSLGSNWSGKVTLKAGHELIRNGLYSRIRHPIYSGILAAMFGTALVRGHLRGWIGSGIVLASFYVKARREERFLQQEFGEAFDSHMRQTGMFLPKLT